MLRPLRAPTKRLIIRSSQNRGVEDGLRVNLPVQVLLRGLALCLYFDLLLQQVAVRFKRRLLIRVEGKLADLLQPFFTAFAVIFCLSPSPSITSAVVSSPSFSSHIGIELLLKRGELIVQRVDGITFRNEVPGDQNWRGNEVRLEAPLAFQVVVRIPGEASLLSLFLT